MLILSTSFLIFIYNQSFLSSSFKLKNYFQKNILIIIIDLWFQANQQTMCSHTTPFLIMKLSCFLFVLFLWSLECRHLYLLLPCFSSSNKATHFLFK
ncbi:hypothetical protein HanIR_Chr08g0351731 [Helianthus annuus]|nr:hypothetical protein HanIR_Chr08g0351731 [Helianthus annuus]